MNVRGLEKSQNDAALNKEIAIPLAEIGVRTILTDQS